MLAKQPSVRSISKRKLLQRCRSLIEAAHTANLAGNHAEGVESAALAVSVALQLEHRKLGATALAILALNELRVGEVEDAVRHGRQALLGLTRAADAEERTRVACTLALACNDMGLHNDALVHAEQAVDAARRAGDAGSMSWALNRAGIAHFGLGSAQQGERLLLEALELARSVGGEDQTFSALNNLCNSLAKASKALKTSARREILLRALDWGTEALQWAHNSKNTFMQGTCLGNLATVYAALGDFDTALERAEQQMVLAERYKYRILLSRASFFLADIERQRGSLTVAVMLFEKALPLSRDLKDHMVLCDIHRGLYECHKQSGNFEAALGHLEALLIFERENLTQRAERKDRLLLHRIELERAQADAERAQLDAEVHRLRAVRLEDENHLLASRAIELGRHAVEDSLTGLANRRQLDAVLPGKFQLSREQRSPFCVAAVDIDHFKKVNDTHGHPIGDAVLKELARLLQASLRTGDLVFRVGGEEFLLMLAGSPLNVALEVCERLRQTVASHPWAAVAPGLEVTISIGLCDAANVNDIPMLLETADRALYAAKRDGRNRVSTAVEVVKATVPSIAAQARKPRSAAGATGGACLSGRKLTA